MADIEEEETVVESKRGRKRKAKTESRKQHEVGIIYFTIEVTAEYPATRNNFFVAGYAVRSEVIQ